MEEIELIKDKVIREFRNLFKHEEEDYYKPLKLCYFWRNNSIEYDSNGGRNKTLSIEEFHIKIRPYLKDFINNLKKSDTWKNQLTIAINFNYSKDIDKEHVMHSNN